MSSGIYLAAAWYCFVCYDNNISGIRPTIRRPRAPQFESLKANYCNRFSMRTYSLICVHVCTWYNSQITVRCSRRWEICELTSLFFSISFSVIQFGSIVCLIEADSVLVFQFIDTDLLARFVTWQLCHFCNDFLIANLEDLVLCTMEAFWSKENTYWIHLLLICGKYCFCSISDACTCMDLTSRQWKVY